ncbi:hypothetical protein ACWDWV_05185 [Streptosporangium sandarakinum]
MAYTTGQIRATVTHIEGCDELLPPAELVDYIADTHDPACLAFLHRGQALRL